MESSDWIWWSASLLIHIDSHTHLSAREVVISRGLFISLCEIAEIQLQQPPADNWMHFKEDDSSPASVVLNSAQLAQDNSSA